MDLAWADCYFKGAQIDYDVVSLEIKQPDDSVLTVTCSGYLQFQIAALWDETMIRSAQLLEGDTRVANAVAAIAHVSKWESGSPARNTGRYKVLAIVLDDGATIECVAAEFAFKPG
jgi:hypothetical protein